MWLTLLLVIALVCGALTVRFSCGGSRSLRFTEGGTS